MRRLRCENLAHGQRQVFLQCFLIRLFRCVLTLFGSYQESVISPAQRGFDVGPGSVKNSAYGSVLRNVVNAFLVEHGFKIAAEPRTVERFLKEIALKGFIFQVFANSLESVLAIEEVPND